MAVAALALQRDDRRLPRSRVLAEYVLPLARRGSKLAARCYRCGTRAATRRRAATRGRAGRTPGRTTLADVLSVHHASYFLCLSVTDRETGFVLRSDGRMTIRTFRPRVAFFSRLRPMALILMVILRAR